MKYKLEKLIDLQMFQSLQDRLNDIYSFPSALIDNDGKILTATGWQEVCTKFHRMNYECELECIKSDKYILEHLDEAKPAVSYRCPHGLVDNAMPIIIDGIHCGNFFTGQFFLETPDLEFFRNQAKIYGFDEVEYLEAVKKVPIWTKNQLDSYLLFIKGLISVISSVGLKNLKEIEVKDQVRKSEEKYRSLIENIHEGIIQVDNDDVIQFVNPRLCELLGYTSEELLGKKGYDIIFEEDINFIKAKNILRFDGISEQYELRMKHKSGQAVHFLMSASPITNSEGEVVGSMSAVTDITERKMVEEKLIESETLYRTLYESASDAIIMMKDNLFIDCNQKSLEMFGCSRNDIIGHAPSEFSPEYQPDGRSSYDMSIEKMSKALSSEDQFFEWKHIRKDGTLFDAEVSLTRMRMSDSTFLQAIVRDVTERKKAENALKESEQFLKETQRIAHLGTYTLDIATGIWDSSEILDEIFGIESDFCKTIESWVSIIHPDWKQTMNDYFFKEVIGKKIKFDKEYKIIRKSDNAERWLHGIGNLKFNDNNEPIFMIGTIKDITEQKSAEEALMKSQKFLQLSIENMLDGFAIYEALFDEPGKMNDYIFVEFNSAAQKTLNVKREDVIGKNALLLFPDISTSGLIEKYADVMVTGQPVIFEDIYYEGDVLDKAITMTCFKIDNKHFACVFRDITNKKITEIALKKQHDFVKSINETSPVGITVVNKNGTITFANSQAEKILGLKKDDITQMNYSAPEWRIKALDGSDFPEEKLPFRQAQSTMKTIFQIEHSVCWEDGTIKFLSVNASPLLDEDGKFNGMISTFEDITESKKNEERLRESEVKYRNLIESSPDGIIVHQKGKIIFANSTTSVLSGFSPNEIIGKDAIEFVHPDYRKVAIDRIRKILISNEPAPIYEEKFIRKDGLILDVEVSAFPFKLNNEPAVQVIFRDITERKETEATIKYIYERYNLAISAGKLGVWDRIIEDDLLIWNDLMYEIYEISSTEFGNSQKEWLKLIHADDREMVINELGMTLKSERDFNTSFRIVTPNGNLKWIKAFGRVTMLSQGKATRMTGINFDITEQKKIETENKAQLDQLLRWHEVTLGREERIAELKAEINTLRKRLGEPVDYPSSENL